MTVRIYDIARRTFGLADADWIADDIVAAIPRLTYFPNVAFDGAASVAQPFRSDVIAVENRTVDSAGWFRCDPIVFGSTPINEEVSQVVLYRTNDNMMLLLIEFTPVTSATGAALMLIQGANRSGLCRL